MCSTVLKQSDLILLSLIISVKTSWLKWKPDWDNAADKYMKAGKYSDFLISCIYKHRT